MKRFVIVLGLCLWVTLSQAGINEGGVLVVHHDPELIYTSASCDSLVLLSDCSQLNPTAAADGSPQWWFILAAFPDSVADRLNTVTFGLGSYSDADLVIGDWGPCQVIGSPLEIPSDGWPAPNTGTSVSWAPDCGGGSLVPVYWFVTYAYGSGTIPLGDHYPGQSGAFVSCGSPPEEDLVSDYGTIGFGAAGSNPCPAQGGGDGPSGGEGPDPEYPEEDPPPPDQGENSPLASTIVSLLLEPDAIVFDPYETEPLPIEEVEFNTEQLKQELLSGGALTIEKSFARSVPGDTLGFDINGDPVTLIDLSNFYHVEFATADEAGNAIDRLRRTTGVTHVELVPERSELFIPNDPLFDFYEAGWIEYDAQWHLKNDGLRDESICDTAVQGFDIQVESLSYWEQALGDQDVIIGIVDVGILDDCEYCGSMGGDCLSEHLDLRVINRFLEHPERFSRYDPAVYDFCGDHGTFMAGFAAALTNNAYGVAGICPDCKILDIAAPGCVEDTCYHAQHRPYCLDDPLVEELGNCGYVSPLDWPGLVNNALEEPLPGTLLALNCSFGGQVVTLASMSVLWKAHQMGIVTAGGSGNACNEHPESNFPADAPFVIGVGGYNHMGQFWELETHCPWDSLSESDTTGTTVGPRNISVCGPTSAPMLTTHAYIRDDPPFSDYYSFSGATSGATAMTSGAVGLIQAIAKLEVGDYLDSDDVVGLIEATALPFSQDPFDPPPPEEGGYNRRCPTCEEDWYGRGRLNVFGVIDVLRHYPPDPQLWVQETFGYEDATSIDVRDFTIGDRTWAEVKVTVHTYLGLAPGPGSGGLPPYMGWVRRKNSNTYANYRAWIQDGWELWHYKLLQMAERGIHDCYMIVDEVGGATITGYLYGYYDENQQIVYEGPTGVQLTDPASLQMSIVNVTTQATAVDDAFVENKVTIELSSGGNPLSFPCRILCSGPATKELQVGIIDVAGRTIRSLFNGEHIGGTRTITWDGLNNVGRAVSSGIYWVNIQTEAGRASRRLVVVR